MIPRFKTASCVVHNRLDAQRESDVVGARFVDGEGEIAFAPPQEIEYGVDDLLGDQAPQEVGIDRARVEQRPAHPDAFIRRALDSGAQFVFANACSADQSARQRLPTVI